MSKADIIITFYLIPIVTAIASFVFFYYISGSFKQAFIISVLTLYLLK